MMSKQSAPPQQRSCLARLIIVVGCCLSQCNGQCTEGDVRLVDGRSYLEGRVEVCSDDRWGTVCDDDWDMPEAQVVCRQLGFSDALSVQGEVLSQAPSAQIIGLDDLLCTGSESRLVNCFKTHNCFHSEDATVTCTHDVVRLTLGGRLYSNNSLVRIEDIGEHDHALLCITNNQQCCSTQSANVSGQWYYPNGTGVQTEETGAGLFYMEISTQTVHLSRPPNAATVTNQNGIYYCEVPDKDGEQVFLYIGVYSENEGNVSISELYYDKVSEAIVCVSTGGPVTTVTWEKDNTSLSIDGTEYTHSKVITDPATATYESRLDFVVKREELSGTYKCTIENSNSSDSSSLEITVCRDGRTTVVESNTNQANQNTLNICFNDIWYNVYGNLKTITSLPFLDELLLQVNTTSIMVSWNPTNEEPIQSDVSCSANNKSITLTSHNTNSVLLEGLAPITTYNCCVTLLLNRTEFLDFVSISCGTATTMSPIVPPQDFTLIPNPNSILLTWIMPMSSKGVIRYEATCVVEHANSEVAIQITKSIRDTNATSTVVDGVSPQTTYNCCITAYLNESSNLITSACDTTTTPREMTLTTMVQPPRLNLISEANDTSISLLWNALDEPEEFELSCTADHMENGYSIEIMMTISANRALLNGLLPSTSYLCCITALVNGTRAISTECTTITTDSSRPVANKPGTQECQSGIAQTSGLGGLAGLLCVILAVLILVMLVMCVRNRQKLAIARDYRSTPAKLPQSNNRYSNFSLIKNPTYLTYDNQDQEQEAERFVINPQYGENPSRGAAVSATYEDIDAFRSRAHGKDPPPHRFDDFSPVYETTGLDDARSYIQQSKKKNPSYLELLPKPPASHDVSDKSGDTAHETKTPSGAAEYEIMLPPRGAEKLKTTIETETTTPEDEEGHYVLAQ